MVKTTRITTEETTNANSVHFPLPGYEIIVANLYRGARVEWVINEFKQYGTLVEIRLPLSRKNSRRTGVECRGWGMVRFMEFDAAQNAITGHHGKVIKPPNTIARTLRVLPCDMNQTLYCAGFPKDWDADKCRDHLVDEYGVEGLEKVDIVEVKDNEGAVKGQFALLTFETHEAAYSCNSKHGKGDNIESSPNLPGVPVGPDKGGIDIRIPYKGVGGPEGLDDLEEGEDGELVAKTEISEEMVEERKAMVTFMRESAKRPYAPMPDDGSELSEVDKANNCYWAVRGMIMGPPPGLDVEPEEPIEADGQQLVIHFADPLRVHAHLNDGAIVSKLTPEQKQALDDKNAEQRRKKEEKRKALGDRDRRDDDDRRKRSRNSFQQQRRAQSQPDHVSGMMAFPTMPQTMVMSQPGMMVMNSNAMSGMMTMQPMQPSQNSNQQLPRNNNEDCKFYLKTGTCKFGQNCKFNHPPQYSQRSDSNQPRQSQQNQSFGSTPQMQSLQSLYQQKTNQQNVSSMSSMPQMMPNMGMVAQGGMMGTGTSMLMNSGQQMMQGVVMPNNGMVSKMPSQQPMQQPMQQMPQMQQTTMMQSSAVSPVGMAFQTRQMSQPQMGFQGQVGYQGNLFRR